MEKMKNRMEDEEIDDHNVKRLKTISSSQGDDKEGTYYGPDSYSYDVDEDDNQDNYKEVNSHKFCCCEAGDLVVPLSAISPIPRQKVYHWVDCDGLYKPMLIVEIEGAPKSFQIDGDEPLPQELYDARLRHRVLPDLSKKAYDERIRGLAMGDVADAYRDLPIHVQAEITRMALAYYRENSDVEYEPVRCVKSRASFSPEIGIHMIFTARLPDYSKGYLFSVHIVTSDTPKVQHCSIISEIDISSVDKGKPCLNTKKVPLKRKNIACDICAQNFQKNTSSISI